MIQIHFGKKSSFIWANDSLAQGLIRMEKMIYSVGQSVAATNVWGENKVNHIFVVMSCPCCEDTGIPHLPHRSMIFVTPYKGIDPKGLKIHSIDIYPPYRDRDGKSEARDAEQFAEHWKKAIEEAVRSAGGIVR
jgi:hypothetical protein